MNDAELLKSYASTGSETAFDQLVERYLGLVFSTARRRLHDPCLAEEVTQSVFCLLAHHAHRLSYRETVAGWLYRTAGLTAAKTLRDELRRRRKEETVVSNIPANSLSDETWASLEPLLEQAMDCLGEKDRLAILLRYYQKQSMREISLVLGSSEDAAKMRVNRAVEKLRAFFKKRGAAHTTAALTVLLAEHCVEAHPQNLAANTLSQVHASLLSGNIPTLSITTTWILMSTLKTKLLVGATTALALWFALGTAIYLTQPSRTSLTKSRDSMGLNTNNPTRAHRDSPQEKRGVIKTLASVAAAPLDYAARKALVIALHTPRLKGSSSYPPPEVEVALALFGNQRVAAFDILQEAFLSKDVEVRMRALSAMGWLGKGETAPRDFLWQVLRSGDQALNFMAVDALRNLDMLSVNDLPALIELLLGQGQILQRYLPQTIMAVMDKDLEAAGPSRNVLENLLDNPDENICMGAACALLKSSGNSNPKIVNVLKKNLLNIKHMSQFLPGMVIDACNAAGPAAKSMVPALLEYARARNADGNEAMSGYAWRTAAKIDPSIANSDAAVAAAVTKEENTMRWRENLAYNNFSYDELTQGLKDRNLAAMAAERLGEMGYAAKDAIPEMLQSVESSPSSEDRDQILAAVHRIDPQVEFTKIPARPIMEGVMAAISALLNQPGPSENESLGLALEERRHARPMPVWLTKNELRAWTRILATNTIAWQAFSNRVQASDTNLQSLLVPPF